MDRKTGYLANIYNVPPLIFRFQINPEILREKKSFRYNPANSFGSWAFDQTSAGSGFIGKLTGAVNDIKEIGSLMVGTRPLVPDEGDPRQFVIDFALDASVPGPLDGDSHYGGSIEPDLAVLRAFINPSWDVFDVGKLLISGFRDVPCFNRPPECDLVYGGLSLTCVMTDLDIKITSFFDDGTPLRAEVSVTLKEQSFAISPLTDFVKRTINLGRSYNREGIGQDFMAVTPVLSLLT